MDTEQQATHDGGGSIRDSLERGLSKAGVRVDDGQEKSVTPAADLLQPWEKEEAQDRENRRESLSKAFETVFGGKSPEEATAHQEAIGTAWDNSREARDLIRQRFNAPLSEVVKSFMEFDKQLQNPETRKTAAENLLRRYLQEPELLPDGDKLGERKSDGKLDLAAYEQDVRDREDLTELLEKHGPKIDYMLKQLLQKDRIMREDPYGGIARLMAQYGEPVTEQHVAENERAAQEQAQLAQYEGFLQSAIDSGEFPQMEAVADMVAEELESPSFPYLNDPSENLREAYRRALERAGAEGVKSIKEKASKSITGGASAGSVNATGGRSVPGSAREALSNAFSSIGGVR